MAFYVHVISSGGSVSVFGDGSDISIEVLKYRRDQSRLPGTISFSDAIPLATCSINLYLYFI